MSRLPTPGGDDDTWGNVLNDFLGVSLNADGTVKNNAVTTGTVTDNAITEAKLAVAVQTKLNASLADATVSTKGIVQLAGDLGGTAASPTVPGLAGKANTSHTHTLANVTDVTATATELNYVTNVTSDIQTQFNAIPVAMDQRHFRTSAVSGTSVSWDSLTAEGLHTNLMLGTQPQGPGGGYYYVQTYSYVSGSLTQMGIPYISTDPIVYRNRYSGVWSSWVYVPRGAATYTTATNANGTYHKYPDGRLECKHEIAVSINSTTVTYNWTYPHTFVTEPVPMAIARSTVPQNLAVSIVDSADLLAIARFQFYRSTSATTTFTLSAYGRWY